MKKYHPDRYINNPLADLAAEKMKEINKAYDMITKGKGSDSAASYGGASSYGGFNNYGAAPTFSAVRALIRSNRIIQAKIMLQSLPKTAEWYYLSGLADIQSGRYTDGIRNMEQAVRMEPGNTEYSDTLASVKHRADSFNTAGGMYTSNADCCPLPCYCMPCFCCDPCTGPCC